MLQYGKQLLEIGRNYNRFIRKLLKIRKNPSQIKQMHLIADSVDLQSLDKPFLLQVLLVPASPENYIIIEPNFSWKEQYYK